MVASTFLNGKDSRFEVPDRLVDSDRCEVTSTSFHAAMMCEVNRPKVGLSVARESLNNWRGDHEMINTHKRNFPVPE